jgi:hypothetical protein
VQQVVLDFLVKNAGAQVDSVELPCYVGGSSSGHCVVVASVMYG